MAQRSDGIETRSRLIKAAADLFSRRGYRDTRVADICEAAGANVAAVNYHFGDKDGLYVEVWRTLVSEAHEIYPPGESSPDLSAEDRLCAQVLALLQRMTNKGRLGRLYRLREFEDVDPTGLIDDTLRRLRSTALRAFEDSIREIMGPGPSEQEVQLVREFTVSLCKSIANRDRVPNHPLKGRKLTRPVLGRLANTVTEFVVGGMNRIPTLKEGGLP